MRTGATPTRRLAATALFGAIEIASSATTAQPVRIETRDLAVVLERENPQARRWDERYVPVCSQRECFELERGVRYRIGGPLVAPSAPFALLSGAVLLRVNEASRAANQVSLGILLTGASILSLGLSVITAWPWVRWDPIIAIGGAIAGGGAVVTGAGGLLLYLYSTRVAQVIEDAATELPAIRVSLVRARF
jgi:hypothetical protein